MTDPLTTLAILEAQATKGPWHCDGGCFIDRADGENVGEADHPDAALIAAARNALPALLELVRLHREWVEAGKEADRVASEDVPNTEEWSERMVAATARCTKAHEALASWTGGRA